MTRPTRLLVFVYGTLKQGQRNHDRFCKGLISAREATVRGNLYDLPFGFPALVVAQEDVLAIGTTDYFADAERQHQAIPGPGSPSLNWDVVYGEVLTFDDPEKHFPALDDLEGFHPGEKNFYRRVLIPAKLVDTEDSVPVWAYAVESAGGVYLPSGRWPS